MAGTLRAGFLEKGLNFDPGGFCPVPPGVVEGKRFDGFRGCRLGGELVKQRTYEEKGDDDGDATRRHCIRGGIDRDGLSSEEAISCENRDFKPVHLHSRDEETTISPFTIGSEI